MRPAGISKCVISPYPPGTALYARVKLSRGEAVDFIADWPEPAAACIGKLGSDGTVQVLCRK